MAEQLDTQATAVSPVSVQEFSKKVKEKYPEYKDVDDATLAKKIVEKYPEYKDKVQFETPEPEVAGSQVGFQPVQPVNAQQQEPPKTYIQQELIDKGHLPKEGLLKGYSPIPELNEPQISATESLHSSIPYVYVNESDQTKNQVVQSIPDTKNDISFDPNKAPKVGQENTIQNVIPQQKSNQEEYFSEAQKNVGGAQIKSNQPGKSLFISSPEEEKMDLAQNIINRSKRQVNAVTGEGDNTGVGDALRDRNFWTLGATDLSSMIYLKKIANKIKNGFPLTDGDKALLEAWNQSEQVNQQYPASKANIWYKTGKNVTDMVPWLVQFAATRGTGSSVAKGIESTLKSNAEKYLGKTIATGLSKGVGELAGAYAAAAFMPSTYSDITRRTLGQTYQDEQGNIKFDISEADSNAKAIYKGWTNGMLEVLTERFGEGVSEGLKMLPKNKLTSLITGEAKGKIGKIFTDFTQKVGWNGIPLEYLEEWVNIPLNAMLVGDNKYSDMFDGKQQLETFLTVAAMGTAMNATQIASNKYDTYKANKDYNSAKNIFNTDIDEQTKNIVESLVNSDIDIYDLSDQLDKVLSSVNGEQAGIITNYVIQSMKHNNLKNTPITTATIEGQQYTINNPEDLGQEGKPIFAKDAEGNVTAVQNHKVENPVTQTLGEIDQANQQAAEQAKLYEGIADPNAQVTDDINENGIRLVKFNNGQSKIITPEGEIVANNQQEEDRILEAVVNGEPLPQPKATETGEVIQPAPEKKVVTQKFGNTSIDIIENEGYDEVVPSEKVPLEKALPALEKKFKDNEDFELQVEKVQVEEPGETKYDKPVKKTVIKSIRIVPKVAENANIVNQNIENVSKNIQQQPEQQNIDNLLTQESSQNNKLSNEESENVNREVAGSAPQTENIPQEEQGQGVGERLEENVNAVPPVATISQIPGDSAPLINETTKTNQVPDAGKLIKQEKVNAKKTKQQARQISPEEQKERKIDRAKALSIEPSTIEQLVLQYIVAGNCLNWDEIKREIFPRSDSEMKQRIWMLKKDAKTIDQLLGLLNGTPMEEEGNQPNVFRNAVIDVVLRNGTRTQMVNRILEIGDQTNIEQTQSDYEQKLAEAMQEQELSEQQLIDSYWEQYVNNNDPNILESDIISLFLQDYEQSENSTDEREIPGTDQGIGIENRENTPGDNQGIGTTSGRKTESGKELTPLEKEIQSLQKERAELLSKKVKTVKNVNARNGLLGDIAAQPSDLFAGEGFDANEAQRIIKSIDDRISVIDKAIVDLTAKNEQVKATAEKEKAGQLKFRTSDKPFIQETIDELQSKAPNAAPVVIVRSLDDVPSVVRYSSGFSSKVEAFYYAGKVYIFPDMIRSRDHLINVWIHENGIHHGIKNIVSYRDMRLFMNKVYDSFRQIAKNNAEFQSIVDRISQDYPNATKQEMADEFLAYLAEKKVSESDLSPMEQTLWQKYLDMFRDFLRRLFNFDSNLLTEKQIIEITRFAVQSNFQQNELAGSNTRNGGGIRQRTSSDVNGSERGVIESSGIQNENASRGTSDVRSRRVLDRNNTGLTISDQASEDLKNRHNALDAITRIGTELNIPVHVINSSELTSDNDQLVFTDNGTVTIVSDRVKSVSEVIKALVKEVAGENGIREMLANSDPNSIIGKQLAKFDELPDGKIEPEKLSQIIRKAFRLTSGQFSNEDLIDAVVNQKSDVSNNVQFRTSDNSEENNLIAVHNIKPAGLLNANRLGGLPMPSLAIVDINNGFDKFGDITLVADKDFIDPKKNRHSKVFAADVYSARYPNINYQIPRSGENKIVNKVNSLFDDKSLASDISHHIKSEIEDGGLRSLSIDQYAQLLFLADTKQPVEIKYSESKISDDVKQAFKDNGWLGLMYHEIHENNEVKKQLTDLYMKKYESDPDLMEIARERFVDEDGILNSNLLRNFIRDVQGDIQRSGKIDTYATVRAADDYIRNNNLQDEFEAYAANLYDQIGVEEKIFRGFSNSGNRMYSPHTLENVLKEMKKDGIRGGEKFGYGAGNVRAMVTPEFKSLPEIQKNRGRIMPFEDDVKSAANDELMEVMDNLKKFYKYESGSFGYYDNASDELVQLARSGRSESFKPIDEESRKIVADFLNKLANMPTEYFEAKINRGVSLAEFKNALIPSNTSPEIREILKFNGINAVEYNDNTDRTEKLKELADEKQLRFRIIGETGAANLDKAEEATTRLDNLAIAREMESDYFDWNKRTSNDILENPFVEGVPSQEKAIAINKWVKYNTDKYNPKYVKFYHATGVGIPIDREGLKRTSTNRRRSFQSESGYVYLANTPERAKSFGDLGNGGNSIVYEVIVPVSELLPDKDQLNNQRSVGNQIGNTIGESIVYGGGVRIKGDISPWQSRRFTPFTAKEIRLATGWEKSGDGKWRYEVPDVELKNSFNNIINQVRNTEDKSLPLSQVIEDENLFKEYPKLKDTKILFYATGSNNVTAFANNTENVIGITVTTPEYEAYRLGGSDQSTPIRAYSDASFKSVLSHEIQHQVQFIEGFGRGGNPETVFNSIVEDRVRQLQEVSGRDTISESEREEIEREVRREYETSYGAYKRLVGEVESRNVQTRMNMTPEERLNTLLSETEDVAREDQIVLMDGLGVNDLRSKITHASSEVNTEPSEAQKQAGNYKLGHIRFDGFDISIENPKGSVRSGIDKQGNEWSQVIPATYGYFRGTVGKDKDHVDVFIGNKPEASNIYVIDQIDPETGKFDEHKVMLGFDSQAKAKRTYLAAFEPGWKGLGQITKTDKQGLKEWFESGDMKKPFSDNAVRFRILGDPRSGLTNIRGSWTKTKIIKELKEIKKTNSSYGKFGLLKGIASFENAQDLRNHLFYHGTGGGVSGALYPSITMSEREAERNGGGGYGQRYFAISVSKSKRKAASFSGQSRSISVYPVILNKEANVIDRPDLNDSNELDDIIEELWNDKVDAVRLGDWSDPHSEQELAVINPNAISTWSGSDSRMVYGMKLADFNEKTDEELENIIDKAKSALIKMAEWEENNKRPVMPEMIEYNLNDPHETVAEAQAKNKQIISERKRIREEYNQLKQAEQRKLADNIRFRIQPRDERFDQLREDLNKVSRFRTASENDLLKSVNETVESNMNESYGIKETPLWERIKKKLNEVKESTQHFKYITEKDFPEVYDKLRQFEAIPDRVKKEAFERVSQIVRPLIKNEEHMRAFERYIVLSDLVHDIEETDLFAGKELPWGYNTIDEIKQDMRNVRAYVMRTPQVLKAIRDRQAMMKEVKKELVANKLLKDNGNDNYFHHQVLAFMEGRANVGVSAKDVRNHKKGWQRSRQGSIALYNTNYVESEFEVMAQSLEQLAIKNMLGEINESINIMPQLIEKAQKNGGKWRDYIPEGYKFWFPKPGTNAYKAASMAEKAVNNLMNDPENPELQAILAEAEGSMWVIPEPVAKQLDEMKDPEKEMIYAEALRAMTGKWKQWTLLNPFRAAKYNFNNMSGDLDIVLAYNPKILEKKYAHTAMTEALNEMRGAGMSEDMKEALRYGVITSGLSIQEIPDINKESLFRSVTKGQGNWAKRVFGKTLGSYWSGVTAFTQFRENILRVAAYKFFKEQIRQGKQPFGVSNHDAIQALYASKANPNEIAGKLARELMGDYGNLSQGGQWIRAHSYPFWSWVEVNAPRYYRLLQNTKFEGNSGVIGRVAGVGAKKTAVNMGMLGVRVMLMTGLVMLWNQIMFPDEDDELQKYGDNKLKLIVGRRDDGSIITVKIQGAFSDVLSFFSLEDAVSDVKELKEGKTTAGKKLAESGNAFVNKFAQGAMPLTRGVMELAMGKTLYPDVFNTRTIRDRGENVAKLVSMDKIYNYLTHKPVRSFGKEVSGLLVYDNNPGEAAYYTMRQKINDFLKDNDQDSPSTEPSDKSNALYYYKKSLKFGDEKGAQFWFDKYRELGGTGQGYKTSMKKGILINSVPKELRGKWFDSLDAEDKDILDLANRWYMDTYLKVGIPVKK